MKCTSDNGEFHQNIGIIKFVVTDLLAIYLTMMSETQTISRRRIGGEWIQNWDRYGRKGSYPDFKTGPLFGHLPKGTTESHADPESGQSVSRPTFETITARGHDRRDAVWCNLRYKISISKSSQYTSESQHCYKPPNVCLPLVHTFLKWFWIRLYRSVNKHLDTLVTPMPKVIPIACHKEPILFSKIILSWHLGFSANHSSRTV
jgi:hypothetical protein